VSLRRLTISVLVTSAAIVALSGCGKSSSTVAPAAAVVNTTPPAAPTNILGLYDALGQRDYLVWNTSSSSDVASYEIWQFSSVNLVNTGNTFVVSASGTSSFVALPVPPQNSIWYYRVRAINSGGTASPFSSAVQIQRHGALQPSSEPADDPGDTGEIRN
jgi:hypothetical protein